MRADHLSEFGQIGVAALAPEQRPTELVLQHLNRARQRRLRDVALVGGAREVQLPGDRQEIANLMHFHDKHLWDDKIALVAVQQTAGVAR
jgi:hypothetical protein